MLPPTSNWTGVPMPPGWPPSKRPRRRPTGRTGPSPGGGTVEPAPRPNRWPVEPARPPTYRSRLGKARGLFSGYLGSVRSKGKIDAATWDDLVEALIRADVGVGATDALLDGLRARVQSGEIVGPDALVDALKAELVAMLTSVDWSLAVPARGPPESAAGGRTPAMPDRAGEPSVDVWLFVGVNGVGKTTTVGKVASRMSGRNPGAAGRRRHLPGRRR